MGMIRSDRPQTVLFLPPWDWDPGGLPKKQCCGSCPPSLSSEGQPSNTVRATKHVREIVGCSEDGENRPPTDMNRM